MLAVRAGPVSGLPVRRTTFHIRLDRVEEAAALSDLRLRLRALWGYEAGFMALMPAALRVALEDIAAGDVWFVIGAKGCFGSGASSYAMSWPEHMSISRITK
jgi:hypothetical protein